MPKEWKIHKNNDKRAGIKDNLFLSSVKASMNFRKLYNQTTTITHGSVVFDGKMSRGFTPSVGHRIIHLDLIVFLTSQSLKQYYVNTRDTAPSAQCAKRKKQKQGFDKWALRFPSHPTDQTKCMPPGTRPSYAQLHAWACISGRRRISQYSV